eukprot:gene171-236_t
MFLGGISGSGPANAAAVGGVMIAAMSRAGYPPSFSASVVGAAAATDILIPPSVAFIIYSVLVPGASVPALFAAGMIPGILAGVALIVPAVWMARKHKMGALEAEMPRPPFWKSLREATWGLAAPVLILGGMRAGWFTPTEAAVVAVFYGLFVGMCIHRTIKVRDLFPILRESGELSAVILIVVSLAGIFAYSLSTLGVIDPVAKAIVNSGLGEYGVLAVSYGAAAIAWLLRPLSRPCQWRAKAAASLACAPPPAAPQRVCWLPAAAPARASMARKVSMPKETLERAIKKGAGLL